MQSDARPFKLDTIELHITNACTQRCPYCYIEATNNIEKVKYGDYDTLEKIITILGKSPINSISLLGGDPVLHPNFLDLIKLIRQNGMRVIVMSNSMEVKDEEFEEVANNIDEIATTIHGKNADEHDRFSKCPGAYDKLIRNLKKFGNMSIPIDVAINIIPETVNNIHSMVENLINEGIKIRNLLTQRILAYGRACNTVRWMATASQVNVAFEQAEQCIKDFGVNLQVEDPYPFCGIDPRFHQYMHGCPEGVRRVAMNMEGYFSRCGADPNYSKHNILENSLEEIWFNSDLFAEFRNRTYLLNECNSCEHKLDCQGGCPIDCLQCRENGFNFIKVFLDNYHSDIG